MIRTCVFNSLRYCIRYFNFVVIRIYKLFLADRDFSVHKYMKMKAVMIESGFIQCLFV